MNIQLRRVNINRISVELRISLKITCVSVDQIHTRSSIELEGMAQTQRDLSFSFIFLELFEFDKLHSICYCAVSNEVSWTSMSL